jgi:aminoglycoside phosphotransferase
VQYDCKVNDISTNNLGAQAKEWLRAVLGATPFKATKHAHSHQDEVYKIETPGANYYLKIASTLIAERDNLQKLAPILPVPQVISFHTANDGPDYLLISELPGKNLVELIDTLADAEIVEIFAQAVKQLHALPPTIVFPEANAHDVLLHGDMALPNIIISEQKKIGYIDFAQLSFGTPELDLADAIWSLQRNLGPAYGELFLQKYGTVTMTPKIQEALAFRYEEPLGKRELEQKGPPHDSQE